MTSVFCFIATCLALLMVPILILAWATESRPERIRRWYRHGMTQQAIADRLGISRYRVRRVLAS